MKSCTTVKRRLLSAILALVMALCLLPGTALADEPAISVKIMGTPLVSCTYYKCVKNTSTSKYELTTENASSTDYNVYYEGENSILQLSNLRISGDNGTFTDVGCEGRCIDIDHPSLTIELIGNSVIKCRNDTALYVFADLDGNLATDLDYGNLTIRGDGSLEATGYTNGNCDMYGICIESGSLNVEGGKIVAKTYNNPANALPSYGVSATGDINVTGGSLTGQSGSVVREYACSYGVCSSSGSITVSGKGELTGTSGWTAYWTDPTKPSEKDKWGEKIDDGYGYYEIYYNAINYGVYALNDITVRDAGKLTGKRADPPKDNDDMAGYDLVCESYGVYAETGRVSVCDIGELTGMCGIVNGIDVDEMSCGVYAKTGISFSGGTVTAQGYTKALNQAPIISSSYVTATAKVDYDGTGEAREPANVSSYKSFYTEPVIIPAITGTVKGSDINAELEGATVQLKKGTIPVGNAVTTGENGAYTIENVPAGAGYTIEVSKEGYATGTISDVEVISGIASQNITLTAVYTITGTVKGSNADTGLEGATVQLKRGTETIGSVVTTGSNGAYTIENVPAETGYTIEVSKVGYATGTIPAFDVSTDTPGKDITMTAVYTITGTVKGSDTNAGLVGATVQLKRGIENIGSAVTTGTNGAYTIENVPAATGYTIEVSMASYSTGIIDAFELSDNMTGMDITLTYTPIVLMAQRSTGGPFSYTVENYSTATTAYVMIGQYDAQGKLLGVKMSEQLTLNSGTITDSLSGIAHSYGSTYKVFLISGDSSFAPLCEACTVN